MMKIRDVVVQGKKRIIFNLKASGEDKVKDAMLVVMGPGWYFEDDEKDGENDGRNI